MLKIPTLDSAARALARPFSIAVLLLGGALCAAGCGSSDDGAPKTNVKDAAGRSCTLTADSMEATCDKPPMPAAGCPATAHACFITGTTGDASGPGAMCAGCCAGNTASSQASDCSNLVCSSNADCPAEYGRCLTGQCRY